MHSWYWKTWQEVPYLACSLLDPWPHGFFTQQFWPQTPETLVTALAETATVHWAKQVHGDQILMPPAVDWQAEPEAAAEPSAAATLKTEAGARPEADAVITSDLQQSVWVCSADCTPALIADTRSGRVAAIHAGWRGTSLKVVPRAVEQMVSLGSRPNDLRVALGPAIAGEVYQVSSQVAAVVGRTIALDLAGLDDLALVQALQAAGLAIQSDPEPGRARLDVRQVNALQLAQMGLAAEQVAIAPYCTYQGVDRFFSYRRTKEKKVQWSGIVSRCCRP